MECEINKRSNTALFEDIKFGECFLLTSNTAGGDVFMKINLTNIDGMENNSYIPNAINLKTGNPVYFSQVCSVYILTNVKIIGDARCL